MITRAELTRRLNTATDHVLAFTRTMVLDHLPDAHLYLIAPNASYDGNPLEMDERVFPDTSLAGGHLEPMDAAGAMKFLWRDGLVPEWMNISVYRTDSDYTYLELLCCGRFTANEELLYHRWEGFPPFHVLSPPIPWGWFRNERGELEADMLWERQLELHGRFPLPAPREEGT